MTGEYLWNDKDKPRDLPAKEVHQKDFLKWWVNSLTIGCITEPGKNNAYMFKAIENMVCIFKYIKQLVNQLLFLT